MVWWTMFLDWRYGVRWRYHERQLDKLRARAERENAESQRRYLEQMWRRAPKT